MAQAPGRGTVSELKQPEHIYSSLMSGFQGNHVTSY